MQTFKSLQLKTVLKDIEEGGDDVSYSDGDMDVSNHVEIIVNPIIVRPI